MYTAGEDTGYIREAAKRVIFLMAVPLGGRGV